MSEMTFEKACTFVNMDHPAIASLLYDLDLLPEQIESDEKRAQMILIVAHFIAEESTPPGDDGLREALERERDDWKDKAMRLLRGDIDQMCSYCGWETSKGGGSWKDLQEHVKICPDHPLGKALIRIHDLESAALGRPAQTQGDGRGARGDTGRIAWAPRPDTGASVPPAPQGEGEPNSITILLHGRDWYSLKNQAKGARMTIDEYIAWTLFHRPVDQRK